MMFPAFMTRESTSRPTEPAGEENKTPPELTEDELNRLRAFVDELADLAADLFLEGRLGAGVVDVGALSDDRGDHDSK